MTAFAAIGYEVPIWAITEACAEVLDDRLRKFRKHPAAAESLHEIRAVAESWRHVVDTPAERLYAGPCATPYYVDEDCGCVCHTSSGQHRPDCDDKHGGENGCGDLHMRDCDAMLFARADRPEIVCRNCGARHDASSREEWLIERVREQLVDDINVARQALEQWLGWRLSESTLRSWRRRQVLQPYPGPWGGVALYRVGDLVDLAHDLKTRREAHWLTGVPTE